MSTHVSSRVLALLADLADLTKTLQVIQQALADLLETQPTEHVPLAPSLPPEDAGKRRQMTTDWPQIGGREFEPAPTRLFETDAFRKAWNPSDVRRACYAAGCFGLRDLSKILKVPVYKISTTGGDRVWDRMDENRRDIYAGLYHDGKAYREDGGIWDNWFPSHLHPHRFPSPASPVIVDARAIVVPLPVGMTVEKFDELFDKEVAKGALNAWVMTQEGRDHCAFLGVNPTIGQRLTRFIAGGQSRISPANEIAGFSIHTGADRMIAIVEKILLEFVGLKLDDGATVKD
jgi:hypothetical protein